MLYYNNLKLKHRKSRSNSGVFSFWLGKKYYPHLDLAPVLISVNFRDEPYLSHFFLLGRIYYGYVGLMMFIGRLHIDIWVVARDQK